MSDEHLQKLIREYNADPVDSPAAARLISALLRERNGEPVSEETSTSSRAIAFFIHCATGCSCCSNENHYTGPWRSLRYAKEAMEGYHNSRRLASQYARNGRYSLGWSEVEILPDGRIVADDNIFGGFSDDPDYEGWNEDISDDFCPDSYNLGDAEYGTPLPDWYVDPHPFNEENKSETKVETETD